jgi:hypothetical protein
VAPFDAPRVTPGRHLLAAETGGERDVLDGQGVRLDDLLPVHVGDRHLGGGDEPEVLDRVPVQVLAEFREVAGAHQAFTADHHRRQDLGVAVLAGVKIQHEADEGALQPGPPGLQHVEARARDFDPPIEVDDPPAGAEIPVGLRGEVVCAPGTFLAHDLVLAVVLAGRHARVRQVGQLQQLVVQLRLGGDAQLGEALQLLLQGCPLRLDLLARLGGGLADLLRQAVLLGGRGLLLVLQLADLLVQGDDAVEVHGRAQADEPVAHQLGIFTDKADVEHEGRGVYYGSGHDESGLGCHRCAGHRRLRAGRLCGREAGR